MYLCYQLLLALVINLNNLMLKTPNTKALENIVKNKNPLFLHGFTLKTTHNSSHCSSTTTEELCSLHRTRVYRDKEGKHGFVSVMF